MTAVASLFCLAELWLHVIIMYKIGAHCVSRMSCLFSLTVVKGHQHTRYDKAFQVCTHAVIVVEELMEICASASSRPGLGLTSQTTCWTYVRSNRHLDTYITMPISAISTSIAPVPQSAKFIMLHRQ